MSNLTKEDIESALPTGVKLTITDEFVNKFNSITDNPIIAEEIKNNFVSHVSVMRESRYKLTDYFNAVTYVSYKLLKYTNKDAYKLTFPDRYQTLVAEGVTDKDISSYVAMYNGNKLVNLVWDQALIPTHILNAHVYQQAINVQADLMITAKSEKVRCDAANSLLTHLKRPESKQIELQIGTKDSTDLKDLKDTLRQLASAQMQQINNGASAKDVARQSIIDVTPREVN
jgi:hypothetical protein